MGTEIERKCNVLTEVVIERDPTLDLTNLRLGQNSLAKLIGIEIEEFRKSFCSPQNLSLENVEEHSQEENLDAIEVADNDSKESPKRSNLSVTFLDSPTPQKPVKQKIPAKRLAGFRQLCIFTHCIYPIAMILVGVIKYNKCPVDHNIPVYIIGGGILGLVFCITEIVKKAPHFKLLLAIVLAQFIWFVHCIVHIFVNYQPDYHLITNLRYCDEFLYKFAMYMSMFQLIIINIQLIYLCFLYASDFKYE